MGKDLDSKRGRSRKRPETTTSSSSSSSSERSESPVRRKKKKSSSSSRKSSSRHRESSRRHSRSHRSGKKEKETKKKTGRRRRRRHSSSSSSSDDADLSERHSSGPEALAGLILETFPDVAGDLEQLLQTIDSGQGVDIRGIPEKALVKLLEKLLLSLKLEKSENGVFLLPPAAPHTLDVIGPILRSHLESRDNHFPTSGSPIKGESVPSDLTHMRGEADIDAAKVPEANGKNDSSMPSRRRVIGPEMPSRELLAAAAELTEAETLLREADLEADDGLLIGPPPPAMVAEAASANEAERFEEVARITGAEVDKPYEVIGVNWKMSSENMKKRYWKLSLLVHPDKCSHPQAHQAFVKLNQAFKDLQDPAKREAIDEKIKLKEVQEEMKAELRSLREAAQWRRLQGISIEGDEELLAVAKEEPKRDEWMTQLPPERKPGMTTQSTSFSRTGKEGRGDTSMWTDNPIDKAEKAKQNYLEAYNKAKAIADGEDVRKMSSDADLVDKYNSSKRAKSLVQKHQEEGRQHLKKKSKSESKSKQPKKGEWVGEHPWKPWDREKDLEAGRKSANLDSKGMAQGLTSRFSSGTVQRNFL